MSEGRARTPGGTWGRARRIAIAAALVAGATVASGAAPTGAPGAAAAPGWDQYGGWTGRTFAATGAFRTAQVDGRWWMVDPEGHPFFSNGLNHVVPEGTPDRNGHAAYHDAILAKHGSEEAWADAQVPRFEGWGINTLGGWSDTGLFAGRKVPYTVMLGLAGHSAPTGRVADFWDPAWVSSVQQQTASAAAGRTDDPWLVGYFLDNEVHWAKDWRKEQLDQFLARPADAPGKQHLVAWLRQRYHNDFAAFAAQFQTDASSWDELLEATTEKSRSAAAQATKDAWVGEMAGRFFAVTDAALKAADPNHLNLGARFIAQLMTPAVVKAAGRHTDVVSINWYEATDATEEGVAGLGPSFVGTADTLADAEALAGKPLLISEFGWRAKDSGLPNSFPPFQVVVDTQADRASRYRNFAECLANTGYVVGAHWFEMTDEPAIGRFDGEDDNWGFVKETDEPWPEVTAAAAEVHDIAYAPATDPSWTPGPCTPQGPQRAAPPTTTTTATSTSTSTSTTTPGAAAPASTPVPGTPRYTG
ncbi:MAG: hypothetical protein U0P45_13250 [Acidimicrobiales bacterium]